MKLRKVLGHLLIVVGICIPLQAFTQICINDISSASQYRAYKEEYMADRASIKGSDQARRASIAKKKSLDKEIDRYNDGLAQDEGIVDPFVADDYKSAYGIKGLDTNAVFGYLIVPSIQVKKPIWLDATYEHLDKGVAHVYGTSLPTGGKGRRSVIAGHRGWYRDIMLLNLGKVKNGDKVYIDRKGQVLTYLVKGREIISPSQWEKLSPRPGKDILTLLSCEPIRPPSPYRLLINCERLEEGKSAKGAKDAKDAKSDFGLSSGPDESDIDRGSRSTPLRYLFYIVTVLAWCLLIFSIYKLVKAVRERK